MSAIAPPVALIQIRSGQEAADHEQLCVRLATGLSERRLAAYNIVEREVGWADVREAPAVVIGGSGDHSVTMRYPFTADLADLVRRIVDAGKPLFGICWGHHFLAYALGGSVRTDDEASEIGSYDVALTDAAESDPLFTRLPRRFAANLVHHDHVVEPPPGATELAISAVCRYQAMRLDSLPVWGTQFHGEMNAQQLRERLLMYRDDYVDDEAELASVLARLRPTADATTPLRRFIELHAASD